MDIRKTGNKIAEDVNQLFDRITNLITVIEKALTYPVSGSQMQALQDKVKADKETLLKLQRIYEDVLMRVTVQFVSREQETRLTALAHKYDVELNLISDRAKEYVIKLKQEQAASSSLSVVTSQLNEKWKEIQECLHDNMERVLDLSDNLEENSPSYKHLNQLYNSFSGLVDAMSNEAKINRTRLSYYRDQANVLRSDLNDEERLINTAQALYDLEVARELLKDNRIDSVITAFRDYLNELEILRGKNDRNPALVEIEEEKQNERYNRLFDRYNDVYTWLQTAVEAQRREQHIDVRKSSGLFGAKNEELHDKMPVNDPVYQLIKH